MRLIISNFSVVPNEYSLISEYSTLESLSNISNVEYILLNIHLTFNNQKLSSNYGFDIAIELRTKYKVQVPIIFYSPLPKSYFEDLSKTQVKYKILFGSASYFLEVPNTKKQTNKLLEKVKPLSLAALHDVSTMLCNLKGIVSDRLNHDLKPNANIEEVFNKVLPFLNNTQKADLDIYNFKQKIIQYQNANDIKKFKEEKEAFRRRFNTVFKIEKDTTITNEETKFKILVLDDEQEILDKLKANLSRFDIITCQQSSEAIKLLKEDTINSIVAVIADWRLYKDDSKTYWQEQQGYDVLDLASKTGFRALFSLTSQDEFLVTQIRNISDVNFKVFKKENIIDTDSVIVIQDVIYEECLQVENTITSLPSSPTWSKCTRKDKTFDKSHQDFYMEIRNGKRHLFIDIDFFADEKVGKIDGYIKDGLVGKLFEITTTLISENATIIVLKLRRVWLALFYTLDEKVIKERELKVQRIMESIPNLAGSSVSSNQLKSKLCLTTKDIKAQRFLPEETAWLKKWELI